MRRAQRRSAAMSHFVPPGPLPPPTPPPPRPLSDRPLPSFPPPPAYRPPPPRTRPGWMKWVAIALGAIMIVLVGIFAALVVGRGNVASRLDERAIVRVIRRPDGGHGVLRQGAEGHRRRPRGHGLPRRRPSGEPAIVQSASSRPPATTATSRPSPRRRSSRSTRTATSRSSTSSGSPRASSRRWRLGLDVVKGAPVVSAGFPESSITQRVGLIKKEGKLLDQTRLPVIDRAHGGVVREGVTPGILVSNDLEPGLSGGPTCDDRGRVLGVNVPNDERHRGQNGAVAASAVKALLDRIQPLRAPHGEGRRGAAQADPGPVPAAARRRSRQGPRARARGHHLGSCPSSGR